MKHLKSWEQDIIVVLLILLFSFFVVGDVASTRYSLRLPGVHEGNILLGSLVPHWGIIIGIKLILFGWLCYAITYKLKIVPHYKARIFLLLVVMNVIAITVVTNNLFHYLF